MQCFCKGQAAQLHAQSRQSTALCIRSASLAHQKPNGYQQPPQKLWQQQQLPLIQSQQQWQQQAQRSSCVVSAAPPEHVEAGSSKKRLAVFVSGGGSNFKAIHAACQKGIINAEVVVSDSALACIEYLAVG
jgi:phosphoribosylglycinamide formyltransferase